WKALHLILCWRWQEPGMMSQSYRQMCASRVAPFERYRSSTVVDRSDDGSPSLGISSVTWRPMPNSSSMNASLTAVKAIQGLNFLNLRRRHRDRRKRVTKREIAVLDWRGLSLRSALKHRAGMPSALPKSKSPETVTRRRNEMPDRR